MKAISFIVFFVMTAVSTKAQEPVNYIFYIENSGTTGGLTHNGIKMLESKVKAVAENDKIYFLISNGATPYECSDKTTALKYIEILSNTSDLPPPDDVRDFNFILDYFMETSSAATFEVKLHLFYTKSEVKSIYKSTNSSQKYLPNLILPKTLAILYPSIKNVEIYYYISGSDEPSIKSELENYHTFGEDGKGFLNELKSITFLD